ncbi:MAG: hypothetical protein JO198_03045 [Candidatus Dormibacteraeota bacterium]|nr:hypothetical protein [Candidatus Dormibacteraeota bacterium]
MSAPKKKPKAKGEHHGIGERLHHAEQVLHDHLLAAEVAAEEAAGYGSVTAAIEAAEAAVDPAHELGDPKASRRRSGPRAAKAGDSTT